MGLRRYIHGSNAVTRPLCKSLLNQLKKWSKLSWATEWPCRPCLGKGTYISLYLRYPNDPTCCCGGGGDDAIYHPVAKKQQLNVFLLPHGSKIQSNKLNTEFQERSRCLEERNHCSGRRDQQDVSWTLNHGRSTYTPLTKPPQKLGLNKALSRETNG